MAKSKKKTGTVKKPQATTVQTSNDEPGTGLVGGRPDDRNPPPPPKPPTQ